MAILDDDDNDDDDDKNDNNHDNDARNSPPRSSIKCSELYWFCFSLSLTRPTHPPVRRAVFQYGQNPNQISGESHLTKKSSKEESDRGRQS